MVPPTTISGNGLDLKTQNAISLAVVHQKLETGSLCKRQSRHYSLPQDAGKAWKIGNDIHTVACGSLTQLHMGFMRPYQAILRVADHKYAHT